MSKKYMERWPKDVPKGMDWLRRWVLEIPESGCWIWEGALNPGGYGSVAFNGKTTGAHRVSYILEYGDIPEGLDLDHLCRVRCCVNPRHLEPVSRSENLKRGETGYNLVCEALEKHYCPVGHPYDEENTYYRKDRPGNRGCKECRRNATREWRKKDKERINV